MLRLPARLSLTTGSPAVPWTATVFMRGDPAAAFGGRGATLASKSILVRYEDEIIVVVVRTGGARVDTAPSESK